MINHLLLHCVKKRVLWNMSLLLVGVVRIMLFLVKQTLISCNGSFVGKKQKKIWRAVCTFILDNLEG